MPFFLRFNLHINWSTTFFILNLAFVDLLYSTISLSMYTFQHMHKRWDWGINFCKLSGNITYTIAYADWMSVAMVAASRSIGDYYNMMLVRYQSQSEF